VSPSIESIADGSYAPLSRPIFVYVRKDVADRPDVKAFVEFYLGEGLGLAQEVGYITLPEAEASSARTRFANKTTGTAKE
jgi:phosphate transport system substrate-binding protein